jgi:hypothetical protein
MTKAKYEKPQDFWKGVKLNRVQVGDTVHFHVDTNSCTSGFIKKPYEARVSVLSYNSYTATEVHHYLRRMVMAVRLVEDTADEDLENLYNAKFGGDGL